MWLLRCIKSKAVWEMSGLTEERIERIVGDLIPRQGLSVFSARDDGDARTIGFLFALTCRRYLDNFDYVLFRDDRVESCGLSLIKSPDDNLHPALSDSHYNVFGLEVAAARTRFAMLLLEDDQLKVRRILKSHIREEAVRRCRNDPTIVRWFAADWLRKLAQAHGALND